MICTNTDHYINTLSTIKKEKEKKKKFERNKLKYLHYLNKMIEKCKVMKFIFSEVSCF